MTLGSNLRKYIFKFSSCCEVTEAIYRNYYGVLRPDSYNTDLFQVAFQLNESAYHYHLRRYPLSEICLDVQMVGLQPKSKLQHTGT